MNPPMSVEHIIEPTTPPPVPYVVPDQYSRPESLTHGNGTVSTPDNS